LLEGVEAVDGWVGLLSMIELIVPRRELLEKLDVPEQVGLVR
jgi:hypothetical protein